jgi:hypothetical protein
MRKTKDWSQYRVTQQIGLKKRSCFSRAYQTTMANCAPATAAAQHIEGPINGNNNRPDNVRMALF